MDNVFALEENVTKDAHAEAIVGLNATKTGCAAGIDWRIVDMLAWNNLGNATNSDGEIGQSRGAREDISALDIVELRS